jgi:L-fuconolactonase
MKTLAGSPNVVVKVGGLGMTHFGFDFHLRPQPALSSEIAAAWKPIVETCIEAFGVDRCMLQSNVPPDKQSCSYGTIWNAFKHITAGCSAAEKAALYTGTARRVYRMP